MTEQHTTVDELLRAVTDLLGADADSLTEQDSLIEWGLDSIQLMKVAGQWRRRGVRVSFAQLARDPSLGSWRALLADQLATAPESTPESARETTPDSTAFAVPEVDPAEPFPLALMQHAYWIGRDDATPLGGVAAHLYVEFDGDGVDPDRLEEAVRALARRHGMLRAGFGEDGTQRILPELPSAALVTHDLRALESDALAARLAEVRDACSHQKLDVAAGEVFSIRLSLLPGGSTRLHVDVDMLAGDALSYRILLADLAHLYRYPDRRMEPIDHSYPQYLAARPWLRKDGIERARQWWQQRVPELASAPDLPLVPESDRADQTRVARKHHWMPAEEKQRLAARAHARGLTPAMVVATAFAEAIAAWSGQSRFLLNLPMFDREDTHPDVGKLVGDFTSSVLLDVDLTDPTGDTSFAGDARRIQDRFHADADYADYSGVEVLRDLSRHQGEQVLAPIVFTSALNLGELFDESVRDCFGQPVWIVSQGPQVLLDAQVTEVSSGLLINWDVRESAFPTGMVDAMFAAFTDLITRLGGTDDAWDSPLPALLPPEQAEVRAQVNATDRPRGGALLQDGFFRRAASHPDAPALLWGIDGRLCYGELADRALRVAAALRERGLRPGETVAVTLPKGPEQITAALGVLAAGAAYVPIGVEQPARRRERIRHTAGFRFVLTGDDHTDDSDQVGALSVAEAMRGSSPLDAPVRVDEESPAYVLFTSGSTGEPKGVQVPHRAAMNTIEDLNDRFEVGEADRCLGVSALDFDLSVYDLFGLAAAGGAVVLVDDAERRDAEQWVELVRRHRVTLVNCVPPLLDMLLQAAEPGDLSSLRVVLLGGDWVGADLPARVAGHAPDCRFAGLGGTTETAIHSTVCEVRQAPAGWRSVPYGTPLANVRCRVVDDRGRDCPDWVPGELWIGGAGVASCYRADEERSAQKFVTRSGVRWYRTGDLARYWPDGTLEFLGRSDHQVKLRGFRVELGEVESVLAEHPGVRGAVAGVLGTAASRLVAAVAAEAGVTAAEVVEWARDRLPEHMVPVRVLVRTELPLTANGKIDRAGVARLWQGEEGDVDSHVPPRGALERVICRVWSEVLDVARVGIADGFFALGGDSVLATVIVGRLREALDTVDISVRTLFAATTVQAMAARLVELDGEPGRLEQIAQIYLDVEELSAEEIDHELSG